MMRSSDPIDQDILKVAFALAGRSACRQDQGVARRSPTWSV